MAASCFFRKSVTSVVLTPGQSQVVATASLVAGHYILIGYVDSMGHDRDASLPPSLASARIGEAHLRVTQPGVSAVTHGARTIVVAEDSVHKVGIQEQRLMLSVGVSITGPAAVELSLRNASGAQNVNAMNPALIGIVVASL